MGMTVKMASKVTNASTPEKCEQRLDDAKKMKSILGREHAEWTKLWDQAMTDDLDPSSIPYRWYYYDQCGCNQVNVKSRKVVAPVGFKVYDPSQTSQRGAHATLHLISDQYGKVFHYKVASGGQGQEPI
eukprot:UN08271